MQPSSTFDVIPMADYALAAQAGVDTVVDCQAGCTGRCQYYAFYEYR